MRHSSHSNHANNHEKYSDNLDVQIKQVQRLVNSNIISPRLANIILSYIIKKDVQDAVKVTLETVLDRGNKDKVLMFGYDRKTTKYT